MTVLASGLARLPMLLASADPATRFFAIFGASFAGVGAIFLILGIVLILSRRRMRSRGVSTTGTIVGYDRGRYRVTSVNQTTSQARFPVVEFQTADGQQIRARARNGSNPRPGRQGAPITVFYDPAKPERFWAETPGGRRMASLGLTLVTGIGLIILIIGVAIFSSSL